MNSAALTARAQLWDTILRAILADLARVGASSLDALDATEYAALLEPLEDRVMLGQIVSLSDAEVRAVRRSIRDNEFRPTYSKVEGYVRQALGLADKTLVSGADASARRVLSRAAAEREFRGRLPSTGENSARTALREKMRKRRQEWETSTTSATKPQPRI